MSADLVLDGVTIVDTDDGSLTPDLTVVITGGTIARIAHGNAAKGAVDARGTFVVPGYNDFHAHPLNQPDPQDGMALMLSLGITGFRQLSGTPELLAARHAGTLLPAADSPALLEMPGEILTGANAATTDAVVAEIQRQKAQGADFIKVIDVTPEVFFAGLAESTRLGLRFLGHLPPVVDVAAAARAGIRSIEHLGPKDSVLLGCSTDEAALRGAIAPAPPRGGPGAGPPPPGAALRAVANPLLNTSPAEFARYERVVETFSAERCRALAAQFVACETWHVPTLTRLRTMAKVDDEAYRTDPNLQFVPLPLRQAWEDVAQLFAQRHEPAARATLAKLLALQFRLVRPLKDAGVHMLTGSDSGGSAAWCIAGFGLHQEFDLLAQAGLTPLEILQMTTRNGAAFLKRPDFGRVAEGAGADLVLLGANPLASAANLHAIAGVVRAGTYYSAAALETLKSRTAHRVASALPSSTAVGPPCC
ncbi:MAG: amidohydrolase family protein [Candidatus Lustribacter sp.]